MKIHLVGAELFHADRQTDIMNIIVALCNFVNVPKNGSKSGGLSLKMLSSLISHIFSILSNLY
jgi:hypothetical protein